MFDKPKSMLVTSEMMKQGKVPLLFSGGACNIQTEEGPIRNPGRDPLAAWLNQEEISYFDPQIHPSTHGREYLWGLDGPQEKKAREFSQLRLYELTPQTIGAVTCLEIMDDARLNRQTIVWFNKGENFIPNGLGTVDQIKNNQALSEKAGSLVHAHLLGYVKAGRHLRNELPLLLRDCSHIVFTHSLEEVKVAIKYLLRANTDIPS